jgi:chitodextrinase
VDGPPGAPQALAARVTGAGDVELSWSAAEDDLGIASYEVLRDGVVVGEVDTLGFTDTAVTPGRTYRYSVRATDTGGNVGPAGGPVVVTTPTPPPADTAAPSRPTGLRATLTGGVPRLTWAASRDNVGVTGYDVLRNGTVVATTTTRAFVDTAAPQGRTHRYTVRARDAAANVSALSTSVSRSVPDTTRPSAVPSLTVSRSGTRATLTWGRASDNVGVAGYLVYRGSTRLARVSGSTVRHTATGLRSGTRYTFRVVPVDAAGNQGPGVSATG